MEVYDRVNGDNPIIKGSYITDSHQVYISDSPHQCTVEDEKPTFTFIPLNTYIRMHIHVGEEYSQTNYAVLL